MQKTASVLFPSACKLGESPFWHVERQSCFWVDIEGCTIYEFNLIEEKFRQWQMPHRVSLIVQAKNNDIILGLQGGIQKLDLESGNLSLITDLNERWHHQRFNDGACDCMGRLWIGTMQLNQQPGTGSLYCLGKNIDVQKKISNLSIPNGVTWSLDNSNMYFTDSPTGEIRSYTFNPTTGDILFEKVAITIPGNMGLPDGIALDEDGYLWVALWGGFGVGRWEMKTGKMVDFINVPAPQVTSCAFIGKDLNQMLITTAREGMTDEELSLYPESGHAFIAMPGVKGASVFKCDLKLN